MFTIYCIECGDEAGTTTCEVTATSMTLCEPCHDAERDHRLQGPYNGLWIPVGGNAFKLNPNHFFETKHIS